MAKQSKQAVDTAPKTHAIKFDVLTGPIATDENAVARGASHPYSINLVTLHSFESMQNVIIDTKHLDYSGMCRALVHDGRAMVAGLIGNFAQHGAIASFIEGIVPRGTRNRSAARGVAFTSMEQYRKLAADLSAQTITAQAELVTVEAELTEMTSLILRAIFAPLDIIADEQAQVLPSRIGSREITLDSVLAATYSRAIRKALLDNDPAKVLAGVGSGYLVTDDIRIPVLKFAQQFIMSLELINFNTDLITTALALVRARAMMLAHIQPVKDEDVQVSMPVATYASPTLDRLVHNLSVLEVALSAQSIADGNVLSQHDYGSALELMAELVNDTEMFQTVDLSQLKKYATRRFFNDDAGRRAAMLVSSLDHHQSRMHVFNRLDLEQQAMVKFLPSTYVADRVSEVCNAFGDTAQLDVIAIASRLLERESSSTSPVQAAVVYVGDVPLRYIAAATADALYVTLITSMDADRLQIVYQVNPGASVFAMPVKSDTGYIITENETLALFAGHDEFEQTEAWVRDDTDDPKAYLKGLVSSKQLASADGTQSLIFKKFLADSPVALSHAGGEDYSIQMPSMAAFMGVTRTIATTAFFPRALRDDFTSRFGVVVDTYNEITRRAKSGRMSAEAARTDILNTLGPVYKWMISVADSAAFCYRINQAMLRTVSVAETYEKRVQLSAALASLAVRAEVGVNAVASVMKGLGLVDPRVIDELLGILKLEHFAERYGAILVKSFTPAMTVR